MNKQELARKIWESANKMRSKIEANEYKDVILGLMFYKYLSDAEVKWLKSEGYSDQDIKDLPSDAGEEPLTELDLAAINFIRTNIGYYIAPKNLFSTWVDRKLDFNVSDIVDAINAFNQNVKNVTNEKHKKVFKDVFESFSVSLTKLGDTAKSQTSTTRDLLYLINEIPTDGKDYDVIGFIYEYLISNFAANAGKKAGEFYTPHEVSVLMAEIIADHLRDRSKVEIYDPTSGSGSLLINTGIAIAKRLGDKNRIQYYAQELKESTYNLTRMNLVMRDIKPDNIFTRNGDTLEDDWPFFEENDPKATYRPLYVDAVVCNPPYSQYWNPLDKEQDPRYRRFGLAPRSTADYAFLLHDLYHLKPDGIMTIVLPHGVLFRGGDEGEIRKNLVEYNHIDAVIGLPPNIFFGTGIPTIVMVLKQKRDRDDVLIVDASKGFEKEGKNNKLRASDIRRIADVVIQRRNVEKFSRVVSRDEIRANDYNLNIPRYVDSSEKPESWDIYASMYGGVPAREIDEFEPFWSAFPRLKRDLFDLTVGAYGALKVDDVKKSVANHPDVKAFVARYVAAFDGFDELLNRELIEETRLTQDMKDVDPAKIPNEEDVLSADVFRRLADIPLVDPYEAYQILDDAWRNIANDLETIRSEGFQATKRVDPRMVVKKKKDKEVEEQDGWVGRLLPFELVQSHLLADELAELRASEERLAEYPALYEEAFEALPEEEKEKDFVNDDKTGFVPKEVVKAVKAKEVDSEVLALLQKVKTASEEESSLKKFIKTKSEALHLRTKVVIEGLSDEQVLELLRQKWIAPLVDALAKTPEKIVVDFAAKLEKLAAKYQTTLADVEKQIVDTEKELASMLDMLTGDEFDLQGLAELKKLLGGM